MLWPLLHNFKMAEAATMKSSETNHQVSHSSKEFVHVSLVHVTQRFDWDCGLSCVQMILNEEARCKYSEIVESLLKELGCGQRVWTIDLVFILDRLEVDHKFCTITVGVDPSYETKMYYKHKQFVAERNRVNELFKVANERNLRIEKRSVDVSEILDHLASSNPVIVLVNSWLLKCNHWMHSMQKFVPRWSKDELYVGHYIVLCGYDTKERSLFFRNPGYGDGLCKTNIEDFEIARRSHGTDDDIIFIWKS